MNETKIALIGVGNMGRALIVSLIAAGYSADKLYISNPSPEKLQLLKEKFGVHTTQNNADAAQQADLIVFAVKPQTMPIVCKELKDIIAKNKPLVVSIAASISTTLMETWLGNKPAIVRAMPNTPAAVNAGATGLFANAYAQGEQKDMAEMLFRSMGVAVWLDNEDQIDLVTAISGSGPAYYFLFMEAMQQAAESMGLSGDTARLLTSQTALGAVRMAMETPQNIMQLRESVTSPNGTTEAAIKVFEAGNIRKLVATAMQAACDRSKEIAAEIEKAI